MGWASWALNQGLITASDLHPTPPSSTKPTKAHNISAEAHSDTQGEMVIVWLLKVGLLFIRIASTCILQV